MASPDGLRLFLGNRLPGEVLDNIFSFGFHLWLAKPVDIVYDVNCLGNDIETTTAVLKHSLSKRTCRVVKYEGYFGGIQLSDISRRDMVFDGPVITNAVIIEYARPRVFFGTTVMGGQLIRWSVNGDGNGNWEPEPPWLMPHLYPWARRPTHPPVRCSTIDW